MVSSNDVRKDMPVMSSDGQSLGRVDSIDGERVKITREGSPDGEHHYFNLSDVARIDEHIHLSKTHAALHSAAAAAASAAGLGTASAAHGHEHRGAPLARTTDKSIVPWIVGALALLALIFALTQCDDRDGARARGDGDSAELANPTVARVPGAPLRSGTMAYDLVSFLAGKDGTPRTFTFDKINFDSGTANLRGADNADLDDLARVLAAYPDSRAAVVGYTDAQGPAAANRELGAERARAVVAALASRGVDPKRLEARSGGEADPAGTNASAGGRFENRRTELVILDR
jgi:outer membrane protein OmpA-like peptidoglycan-associated protein